MKISVISLISYDAMYLIDSIKSYYEYVDEIILGLDKDRISWSGNRFHFDETEFYKKLKELDKQEKIFVIEHNFHASKIALENDNFERNYLRAQCSNELIISIDADEVLLNAKDFFYKYLPISGRYINTADFAFTWFLPYKEFENEYLVIGNDDGTWFRGDTQGFMTNKSTQYTYCRWTNNKRIVLSPLAILHWSFCRSKEALEQKLNNFGHSDKTAEDPFFNVWQQINLDNFHNLRNFKSSGMGNNQWPRLLKVPKDRFLEIANFETQRIM